MNSIHTKSPLLKKPHHKSIYQAVNLKKMKVKTKAIRTSVLPCIYSVTYQNSFQLHHETDKIWTAVQPLEETQYQLIFFKS